VHPEDRETCLKAWSEALATRSNLVNEYRLRAADGSYHWIADHGAPFFDGDGVFAGFVGSCYDLQPARDNARDIRRMTHLYQALSATNKAIVHTRDAATLLHQVARVAVEYGDLDLAWIGLLKGGVLRPVAAWGEGAEAVLAGAWALPGGVPAEARVFNDGAAMAGAGLTSPRGLPDGSCALFPISGEDGHEGVLVLRKAAAGFFDAHAVSLFDEMSADIGFALRNYRRDESLNLAARVFENNSEGFVVVAPDRRVVMINRAFTTLTGFTEDVVRGQPLVLFDPEHHPRGFATTVRDVAAQGGPWKGEVWIRRRNGETFPADMSVSAVCGPDGRVTHYVGVFSDISQRKADEARIRFLASHDFLTGLPSRAALETTVAAAIAAARRDACRVALCFLDLDRFKNVNDTLGHHIGDQLLVEVAQRLQSVMNGDECALRHGGDEFVVVMPVDGGREVQARAAGRLLGALEEPFRLAGCEFTLSGSIGVAIWPEDGDDADTLLDRADMAMYRAKEEGRNAIEFFADGMTTPTSERLSLEHALRRALERNELRLHYQPLVAADDGRLLGAEALLRWTHPELGEVSPGRFIPLAEESGLILPIGNRVLDAVVRPAGRLAGRGAPPGAGGRQHLRPAVPAGGFCRHRGRSAAPPRHSGCAADPGSHREHGDARCGKSRPPAHRAEGPRPVHRHRRFRHRLLQPCLSQALPPRQAQDRPVLRARDQRGAGRQGHRRRHRRPRPQPGAEAGGRGCRNRCHGHDPVGAGLRRVPGLAAAYGRAEPADVFAARLAC
jgi:diguanylate cyclase (GGDEF)-like protein/PAS domain S-box-containing protein